MNKRIINRKASFSVNSTSALSDAMTWLEENLSDLIKDHKSVMRTVLIVEETTALLLENAREGAVLVVKISKTLGNLEVIISAEGSEITLSEIKKLDGANTECLDDDDAENAIRSILLKALGEKLKFSYKNGANRVRILAAENENLMLKRTLAALFLGSILGLLMAAVIPGKISNIISEYALDPVRTMFMNALKMVIAPVIFFSIVSCISQFKNIAELGKIGIKVLFMYLLTTMIAIFMSLGISLVIRPGEPGFATSLVTESLTQRTYGNNISLLNTIISVIPSNFIKPFIESDTLSIIFLAVICGVAVGMIGEYSNVLKEFFEACNSLFLTITMMISRFIPLAVFCSAALMFNKMGGKSFFNVLGMAGTQILSLLCMLCVYGLLILIFGGLSPLTFYKKNREGMLTSFSLSSSSAAIPSNLKTCTEYLGISPKVCHFSVPLGATINMDGTCILLITSALFLARAYDVEIPGSSILTLVLTTLILSLGAPGVPGAGILCVSIVLEAIGVPVDGVAIIMGIYPILDMVDTMSNTTGDVAAALIVAKSEGLLDIEKYNS